MIMQVISVHVGTDNTLMIRKGSLGVLYTYIMNELRIKVLNHGK